MKKAESKAWEIVSSVNLKCRNAGEIAAERSYLRAMIEAAISEAARSEILTPRKAETMQTTRPQRYCVIGQDSKTSPAAIRRTWFEDLTSAVDHAKSLARDGFEQRGKPIRLAVVQVVKIVEIGMPDITIRDPE